MTGDAIEHDSANGALGLPPPNLGEPGSLQSHLGGLAIDDGQEFPDYHHQQQHLLGNDQVYTWYMVNVCRCCAH